MDFLTFIIPTQIPVVLFLLILGIQTYRILGIKEFKYISWAWAINLIYLCVNLISSFFDIYDRTFSYVASNLLNALSTFFFFLAIKQNIEYGPFDIFRKLPNIFFILVFLMAAILKIPYNSLNIFPYIAIHHIPDALINFLVLFLLAQYFRRVSKKYKQSNLLFFGTLLYACIQLLTVIEVDSFLGKTDVLITNIGFSIALFSKIIILISLSMLLISVGKEFTSKEAIANRLDSILARTFHEITPPLMNTQNLLEKLLRNENEGFRFNKTTKHLIEELDNSINRIDAIINTSVNLYNPSTKTTILQEDFQSNEVSKRKESVNLNTLCETALMTIKNQLKEKKVLYKVQYAGRCDLICNSNEIVQVLLNILKNAIEAFNSLDGEIHIKTSHQMLFKDENDKNKYLTIEIADNGIGINEDIKKHIYDEKFTTKEGSKGRGYGLAIVKELVEKNDGRIMLESPLINHSFKSLNGGGTKFTIYFKHLKLF
ncbi:MAG TPA: HAMP domain-containing sensor histidine kinase [Bacteroidia bacterium]|nr:HAMP domain-containing sensor histidine kinase [Bacteroidia bacterium]